MYRRAKNQSGRGATSNASSKRFHLPSREIDGDWADGREGVDGVASAVRTEVQRIHSKTIISYNKSPDIAFDRSVNTIQGCEHGCVYCYARPTHAYHDLSPGLDFETKLFAKPDAPAILREELRRSGYVPAPIAMGTNTDPYQPVEGDLRIARGVIEVLADCGHPLIITTKSDRVVRDLDLLQGMATRGLVAVAISVTSLDPHIAMTVEPRAPTPERRLKAVKTLIDAGVPTFVNIAPVIPAITDNELEGIIARAAEMGANNVSCIPIRLPLEVAPLFKDWLNVYFPERAGKVMAIIQSLRGGRDNDPRFFERMRGEGPWADLLQTRCRIAKAKYGFPPERRSLDLRCDLFRPPAGAQGELLI